MFAEAIVTSVMSGDVDPLDVRSKVDAIEKIIKEIKDDQSFKDAVLDQADTYAEKTFEHNNVKFTKAESAQWDYSDDEIWQGLKDQEKEIAEQRKSEEEILKALKQPTEVNGVLRHPPFRKATTYVRVTFG